MRQRAHRKIFFVSCLLLAFFLPVFPRLLPLLILIMITNWLISGEYLTTIPQLFKERWRILTFSFALLYVLYLLGMLYSSNYTYGRFDLEVKFSLLIFPVIFATSNLNVFTFSRNRLIFGAFIAGCLVGSLVLISHTYIVNTRWGVQNAFYYTNISWYFHPSYLAMYYTFGIGITLYYLYRNLLNQPVYRIVCISLIIIYLEAFIFLLSSKAGVIMLITTEILFILFLIFKKIGLIRIILVSVIMVMAFFVFSRVFPFASARISKADSMISSTHTVQTNPNDGTLSRIEIWKVSIGLIRKHFIFGVGTGDVKDVFMDAYQQQNLYPVLKKRLNAHNQYFQTFITLGILGFSLLLASLLIPAYLSLRNGNYLYTLFLLIFAINILFESMLETQAGVIFYAFFNTFLFSKSAVATTNANATQ